MTPDQRAMVLDSLAAVSEKALTDDDLRRLGDALRVMGATEPSEVTPLDDAHWRNFPASTLRANAPEIVRRLLRDLAEETRVAEREYHERLLLAAERDEMRDARDRLIAENDRLRARLADIETRAEGLDVTEDWKVAR